MLIKPKAGQPAKIKVVGVGGGGGNAVASMIIEEDIKGVQFMVMNTDAQALLNHKADIKIQIGETLTRGLGSGGDPEVGFKASEESREKIKESLDGADMIFLASGMGGGTGSGGSPIIAEIAKETGALTVAVVTKPFKFEGTRRMLVAEESIEKLKEKVDTLIVIPNQKILEHIDNKMSILQAFKKVDSILHHGVKGIAELITTPGLINVDFSDVKTIMSNAGTALMGIGSASGEKRTISAIKQAISSPLLEVSIEGAKGVLFNIVGGPDLTMNEVDEAASIIEKTVDPDADIIFGAVIDEKMADQVKITVIATKFDEGRLKLFRSRQQIDNLSSVETGQKQSSVTNQNMEDVISVQEDAFSDKDTAEFDIPAFLRKK